jgi:hypothetical protein
MARLNHPNVVGVFDVGTHGSELFVAMEYVQGQTLEAWLLAWPREWHDILGAFVAAGRGLAAAHGVGLVHRDFKAENALVGMDSRVRVTDFGLAHVDQGRSVSGELALAPPEARELTGPGQVMGTPAYMAPEQFAGQALDARTDQFNFCAALYEALYGERAFEGDSYWALAASVQKGKVRPAPPGRRVPRRVRAALLRGLSVKPEARFEGMEALLEALEADPVRRWGPRAAMGAAVLALAATVAQAVSVSHAESTRCAREAEADAAVLAVGGAVPPALAAWAEAWKAAQTESCQRQRKPQGLSRAEAQHQSTCLESLLSAGRGVAGSMRGTALKTEGARRAAALDLIPPQECLSPVQASSGPASPALLSRLVEGTQLNRQGKLAEAAQVAQEVLAAATAAGSLDGQAEAKRLLAVVARGRHQDLAALALFREVVRLAEASRNDYLLALARTDVVVMLGQSLGKYDEAQAAALDARAAIERVGSPQLLAKLDRTLGNIAVNQGSKEGVMYLERALKTLTDAYGPRAAQRCWALNDLGRAVAEERGDNARAAALFREAAALEQSELGDDAPDLPVFLGNEANAWLAASRNEQALDAFSRALKAAERSGDTEAETRVDLLSSRVQVYLDMGKDALARADIEEATRLSASTELESSTKAVLEAGLAQIALNAGQRGEALRHARASLAEAGARPGELHILANARFLVAQALGRGDREAEALARQALEYYEKPETDDPGTLAKLRAWLARR